MIAPTTSRHPSPINIVKLERGVAMGHRTRHTPEYIGCSPTNKPLNMAYHRFVHPSHHSRQLKQLPQIVIITEQILHFDAARETVDPLILNPNVIDGAIDLEAPEESVHLLDTLGAQLLNGSGCYIVVVGLVE